MKYYQFEDNKKDKGNRYRILDEGTYPGGRKVTQNLQENELMIGVFFTKECPDETTCINLIKGENQIPVSCLCEHLKEYPLKEDGEQNINRMVCNYNSDKNRDFYNITSLIPVDCPLFKSNCVGCNKLNSVEVNPTPDKSHCYVICDHKR